MQLGMKLRRSRHDEVFAGVLGGCAEFFGLDAGRLRTGYVVASLLSGGFPGIAIYLMLWYVMPESEY